MTWFRNGADLKINQVAEKNKLYHEFREGHISQLIGIALDEIHNFSDH
jgi:hypothetical protein